MISSQAAELRCGICDVNTLCDPKSKGHKLFDKQFLSACIQGYGRWCKCKAAAVFHSKWPLWQVHCDMTFDIISAEREFCIPR